MVAENFKVFDTDTFDCKGLWKLGQGEWDSVGFFVLRRVQQGFSIDFLSTMFACGDSGVRVATCFEKLAHFFAFAYKIGVVTVVTSPILTLKVKCSHCVPIFQKGNGKAIKSHLNNY